MKYLTKQYKSKRSRFKDFDLSRALSKKFSIYARGGDIEKSFKQRLGKKTNKNLERRYKNMDVMSKVLKKIEDLRSGRF